MQVVLGCTASKLHACSMHCSLHNFVDKAVHRTSMHAKCLSLTLTILLNVGLDLTQYCFAQDAAVDAKKGQSSPLSPQGFLSEVFAGQLSSTVTCETCHHQSTTLEPFMDLSLPIQVDTLARLESFDRCLRTAISACTVNKVCIAAL